jgi:hypothetical protein
MKPGELLRRLRRYAKARGLDMDISEGKKHTKIKLGGRRSLVGRHPGDLKTGTVQGILKQPGVTAKDIEQ